MRRAGVDLGRAGLAQRLGAGDQRAAGDDHVVAHDRDLALDVADHLGDLGDVVRGPRLVQDREVGLEHLGEAAAPSSRGRRRARPTTTPSPRKPLVAEVLREERQRGHVVDRDREEALDLAGVEVHRQHAVGAGGLEHVGDELGRDRLARRRLLVLARVGEPGHDGGDPLRRGELRRVDHDQQLHQVVVRPASLPGLDDEDVGAADRLLVAAVDLAVGERLQLDLAELDAELLGDPLARARGSSGRRRASAASAGRARSSGARSPRGCAGVSASRARERASAQSLSLLSDVAFLR